MDPKDVLKKEFVFRQFFGRSLELSGDDIKSFTLTIFDRTLNQSFKFLAGKSVQLIDQKALGIYAGKNIYNQDVVYDMTIHPHLLIAGETGSGKSTQLRSIITTFILCFDPTQLQIYMADLKRSEFHLFRQIAHVQSVDVSAEALRGTLEGLKNESLRRGDLLDKHEVTHIHDLPEKLPYIVLCIDEVALLQRDKSVMAIIEDLSAVGRALGIFLILSMQRPDSKVMDGKLKVNLTVRMGFRTADAINSRIIGTKGSEQIESKDKGRMIIKLEQLQEVQAPYLSEGEAKRLLAPYKVEKPAEETVDTSPSIPADQPKKENKIFGVLKHERP
ncbi:cell division protein FtsK [Geomicrobium sp. JCM 19037]|uniref:FtsK/SpoIIIE domain-containing protein n=1 Tax=Geomicrobium sp. JCM 19037 TaxID=1460634 RepID=UPI00045F24C3|nr:FtsK/SpoIIIE domain-containing protein [Geomicrobium sp. JCM 19037]GAK05648.1 cell division protein FtsK [Geomicrobium sp. JCM 19037]